MGGNCASCGYPQQHEAPADSKAAAGEGHGLSVLVCAPAAACKAAARGVLDLARLRGAKAAVSLLGARATPQNVAARIARLGPHCRAGETLVLHFIGDRGDAGFVHLAGGSEMSDELLADVVRRSVPEGVSVLLVCDGGHAEMGRSQAWADVPVASLCGSAPGESGALTEAMLTVSAGLEPACTLESLRQAILERVPADVSISPENVPWPLARGPRPRETERNLPQMDPRGPPVMPVHAGEPTVHLLVCALDYDKTAFPLTCTVDGTNMLSLARQCNVHHVSTLLNEQATRTNVVQQIESIGRHCRPGDYFVFFYAGHGTNLPDRDGDEEDGQDEAYCLVDEGGQLSVSTFLSDDDFARVMTSSVPRSTNILIVSDCCHSASIADFNRPEWRGHRALSMSGCTDSQTSGDTGAGGVFTHSLLMGIERISQRQASFSVGSLFREVLDVDDHVFRSPQDITIQAAPGVAYDMLWPLAPRTVYKAPYRPTRALNVAVPGSCAAEPLPTLLQAAPPAEQDEAKRIPPVGGEEMETAGLESMPLNGGEELERTEAKRNHVAGGEVEEVTMKDCGCSGWRRRRR